MFTLVKPITRHVTPAEVGDRRLMKVVYVVLEPQYQSALTAAVQHINAHNSKLAVELSGYLVEELRDPAGYEAFRRDLETANVFIGSLIFIEDIAQKVVQAVEPLREQLDAVVVFPSMPEVMRLNKMGAFSMAQLGQSKSAIAQFMRKRQQGSNFQEGMLKLLQTLPKVLKYLPFDKAQDARNFMLSFQYWLGGSRENLENFLLMLADRYLPGMRGQLSFAEPVTYLEMGIWHPLAPQMFASLAEYLDWYNAREDLPQDVKDPLAPCVGLVLQRTHLVTGDDAHYVAMVQELESRGARVVPVFAGGLDFSKPVNEFFWNAQKTTPVVDVVVSLTGFALVGGAGAAGSPQGGGSAATAESPLHGGAALGVSIDGGMGCQRPGAAPGAGGSADCHSRAGRGH
jgi:magnesium chelatase subunit H